MLRAADPSDLKSLGSDDGSSTVDELAGQRSPARPQP
jgi:hypothetical protein